MLAVYYLLTDVVIISQVYYYRRPTDEIVYDSTIEETTPLVSHNRSTPESRRQARIKQFLSIFLSLVGVCLTGAIAYFISSRSQEISDYTSLPILVLNIHKQGTELLPQIFGWVSAILYRK